MFGWLGSKFKIESLSYVQERHSAILISSRYEMSMNEIHPKISGRIAELIDRISRLTRELQYVENLNPAQWEALRFICRANIYSRTPGALAEFLGTTKGTTSQTLISLENKGLIRKARSQTDRRVIQLELTEAGQALVLQDPILKIQRMADGLDAHTGAEIVKGLSRLLRDMQVEVGAKDFGFCAACMQYQGAPSGSENQLNYCGVTGEPIDPSDLERLCVNFQPYQSAGDDDDDAKPANG